MSTFLLPLFPFPPFLHLSFLLVLPTLLFLPSGVYTDVVPSRPARSHPSVAPVALSGLAGASCTTCTATTSTAARPRRPSAPARHRTRCAQ
ncbi:hypothetical protein B0H13DRAFT_884130 [Mycena leptocephala]|nr:hypothetical protein B0H13DRAFT_884130 [Mycena leptocephala]